MLSGRQGRMRAQKGLWSARRQPRDISWPTLALLIPVHVQSGHGKTPREHNSASSVLSPRHAEAVQVRQWSQQQRHWANNAL